ncbi:TetR family transcriptional regulator [Rhodococcus sp. IEGM 1343]|uniref:TetR family transcriptional regulator n=1 Tax=Rhodococcus sp. IEGM 1343 TaxID=3082224 RepID=UPI0029540E5C|nr:TetR family transcriptional regulator [Rhodococcus sp. IEGM 1343]MDV8056436.1 TetR family transcriptional regulator [Rhodococcus sp. IEGM 1343]
MRSDTPPARRRGTRITPTRLALIEAASMEVSSRGYVAANLGDILERAGATKGGMYFHFDNKLALITAVADAAAVSWNHLAGAAAGLAPQTPDEIATAIVGAAGSTTAKAGLMLRGDPEFRWASELSTPGDIDAVIETILDTLPTRLNPTERAGAAHAIVAVLIGSVRIGSAKSGAPDFAARLHAAIVRILRTRGPLPERT